MNNNKAGFPALFNNRECDILNKKEEICRLEEQMKREEILNKHEKKYKIVQGKGKDRRWHTYVDVGGKKKLVAKCEKEVLEDYLIDFYTGQLEIPFERAFELFIDYKRPMVSDNTVTKYGYDFKRYFGGTKFAATKVSAIDENDCISFIVSSIREKALRKKHFDAMYSIMTGTFRYLWNRRMIDENPMDRIEKKVFYRQCTREPKNTKKRIVSSDELGIIKAQIAADRERNPHVMTGWPVELAILTGMRAGELVGLTWDSVDFNNHIITVDKAEIYHTSTKTSEIGDTKNGEIRYIPMTPEIEDLLRRVREVEDKFGYACEFVFSSRTGRITKNAVWKYMESVSARAGLKDTKTIHSFRRTLNSKLKFVGADTETAASMMGHTEEVNIYNYSYDVTDMNYKRNILEQAQKIY